MKDLFEVLKETLNTSSKGLGNTGTKNGATGLLGSAAVGGLLAALFGGSKVLKGVAKDTATVGGGAIAHIKFSRNGFKTKTEMLKRSLLLPKEPIKASAVPVLQIPAII